MNLYTLPSSSPKQTFVQDFGLGKITIAYSRPSLRGRTVFGENSLLAPLGKLWRTGADASTLITFSDDVTIGETNILANTYSLFVIPQASSWEIIINKGVNGISAYTEQEDVLRMTVPVKKVVDFVETFTINLHKLSYERCTIQLSWGNALAEVTVETKIIERLKHSYEVQLASDNKPHFPAAYFYHLLGNDNTKALQHVNIALESNASAYYMHYLKTIIEICFGRFRSCKS